MDDFIEAMQRNPDLLEIFDFLNKGVTDTVVHNNDNRLRELQISKEIQHVERFLESVNMYLLGEITTVFDITARNADQPFPPKIDFKDFNRVKIENTTKKRTIIYFLFEL